MDKIELRINDVLVYVQGVTSAPTPAPTPTPTPITPPTPVIMPSGGIKIVTWGMGTDPVGMPEAQHFMNPGETIAFKIAEGQLFGVLQRVKVSLYEANGAFTVNVNSTPGIIDNPAAHTTGLDNRFPDYRYLNSHVSDAEAASLAPYNVLRLPPADVNGFYYINVKANELTTPFPPNPYSFFLFYTPQ